MISFEFHFKKRWNETLKPLCFPIFSNFRSHCWLREKGAGVRWTPLCKTQKHRPRRQTRPWTNSRKLRLLARLRYPKLFMPWSGIQFWPLHRASVFFIVRRTRRQMLTPCYEPARAPTLGGKLGQVLTHKCKKKKRYSVGNTFSFIWQVAPV